jgi:hypothetical protein
MNKPAVNAFHWQGKSETIDKYGRMKTERQMLLDATRVNQYSDVGRNCPSDRDRINSTSGKHISTRRA